jgi:hypothetical protein
MGMNYHQSPKMPKAWARVEWCREQFGESMRIDGRYRSNAVNERWYRSGGRLYFRDEKVLLLFLMKWA